MTPQEQAAADAAAKQTALGTMAQDGNVQHDDTVSQQKKDEAEQDIRDGHATLPGTDPEGAKVSPQLDGAKSAEVPSIKGAYVPRQYDNGVRATLPSDAVIGPDSPHASPMPGTNQVNPSAESLVAVGLPLDPTARQQHVG